MKWYAYKNFVRQSVDLVLVHEGNGQRAIGDPLNLTLTIENPDDVGTIREPTLSLPHEAAQALLQALWDEGFRPNNGEGGPAEAVALRKHIAFAERVALALLLTPDTSDDKSPVQS